MAIVTLNTLDIPNNPSMATPLNILNWLDASFSGVGKVFLRSFSPPTATNPYETLLFKGTNLSITADDGPNIVADGQPLSARTGTGIITEFTYGYSTTASFAYYPYTIFGLSINVADFLSHGGDVLNYVLSGADVIVGTRHAEVLMGYGGDDVLRPGMADNAVPATRDFPGALHSDVVDGGAGNDTVSFEGITIDLSINLATHSAIDRQAPVGPIATLQVQSTLISIENATGGDGHDMLVGDAQINILNGGAGNDALYGGAGNDTLVGGIGNDILRGDAGADMINGGDGVDRADYTTSTVGVIVNLLNGTASDGDTLANIENIYGSTLNDVLLGSDVANALYGYNGNDQLFGLGGNDNLSGQNGDDALHGGDGYDVVNGGDGNDGLFGDAGNDRLVGGIGNDFLDGGLGNDTLLDDAGNDQLYGGAGSDIFTLGAGNDYFSLGAGDDRVLFVTGNGNDTIGDFHNGHDVIDFTGTGVTLASLQTHAVETSQGAMLVFGTDSILLAGLHLPQINWTADFVFSV